MARTFRSLFRWMVPRWLSNGDGGLVLWTLSSLLDAFAERARQGVNARFPSRSSLSGLELLGRSRGVFRGLTETPAQYAARLKAWRYPRGHRVRGTDLGLLDQIFQYWGGAPCSVRSIRGKETLLYSDGTWETTYQYATPPLYSGTWSQAVVFLDARSFAAPTPDFGDPELWNGFVPAPGYSFGQVGVTPDDVDAFRRLAQRPWSWIPAHAKCDWIIVQVDANAPTKTGYPGAYVQAPWYQSTTYLGEHAQGVALSYIDQQRMWCLRPDVANTWAGLDIYSFWWAYVTIDGLYEAGDPNNWPDPVTLPGGVSYSGEAVWHETVTLIDDGAQA